MSIHFISYESYRQTRVFFRRKATMGSGNKRYADNASAGPDKIERRRQRLLQASPLISHIQNNVRPGKTPYEYGAWLHKQGAAAAGNCGEMSCVALYQVLSKQTRYSIPFPVSYVRLAAPGDHAFLVAGCMPVGSVGEWSTVDVQTMCDAVPEAERSYVLDIWAGIFCQTRDYPAEVRRKMVKKWSARGKEVWWGTTKDWTDPGADLYVNSLLHSRFYVRDLNLPF